MDPQLCDRWNAQIRRQTKSIPEGVRRTDEHFARTKDGWPASARGSGKLEPGRTESMGHVFISYAHENAPEATRLARALELSRIPVWWDPKIQLGRPFSSAIQNALVEAAAVVVLWSRASIGSPWVLKEARLASQRGVLLPALLDRVTPPGEFAGLDCADLSDWDPDKPHREFDQIRRVVLSSVSGRAGAGSAGDWHAERLDRQTLAVRLDRERHTVQYSRGDVYVDGELAQGGVASVIDRRTYQFELSDGAQRYFAELTVWVSAFRGDVKRLALKVGGKVLYSD